MTAVPPRPAAPDEWAEVSWADAEIKGELPCCDWRHHTGDEQCPCPEHPQSYDHPNGQQPWPAP